MLLSDIVTKLAEKHSDECTRRQMKAHVDTMLSVMRGALLKGRRIELRRFGTWVLRVLKPRTARNPRNGMPVHKDERVVLRFKASSALGQRVQANKDKCDIAVFSRTASKETEEA